MNRKGFTLVELVIVIAVVGMLAAVVIPWLVRSRIAANESATLGDIRTLISAQTAYSAANAGFYDGALTCLTQPSNANCIPSYPTNGPTFLDITLASLVNKAGYNRQYTVMITGGLPPNASPSSVRRYRYDATPLSIGMTGVRGFAADNSGRICFTSNGLPVAANIDQLPLNCADVR